MNGRTALLIGVESCDHSLFTAMEDVVAADIARMTDALQQSGYDIWHCGVGEESGREPTGNRIRAAMQRTLRDAPAGGVVLLYFSGHGVVLNGNSYLVPQDAFAGPDGLDVQSLVPVVPQHVPDCLARLLLFVVEARCGGLSETPSLALPRRGGLPWPADGAFVILNSSGPGERGLHGEGGGYFTEAVAGVLDRRDPARTLDEVRDAVARRLGRKVARMDGFVQTPQFLTAAADPCAVVPGELVICEGDRIGEAWRRAVGGTSLWQRSTVGSQATGQVRAAVAQIVDDCARQWLAARETLTSGGLSDPWSAQDYPVRVLAAMDALLPAAIRLRPAELAAVVAAPFLREVGFSTGLLLAATVSPHDFSRTYEDGPRSDLEITHAMHEHVCRRAEGLDRRGHTEPRDALAMWLVYRWLAGRSALWDDPTVTIMCRRLASAVGVGGETLLTERELCEQLRVLLRCVDADPDDERAVEYVGRYAFDRRIRTLAALLWLAGVLAADPRNVPTVVGDHIGIGAELPLPTLHSALARAKWRPDPHHGLALHAVCDHPALLATFEHLVRRAEQVRQTLTQLDLAPDIAAGVPDRCTGAGLRPEIHDGAPVFDVPLLRFRLSDEKIRELLMGRQLYGEPDLAIRELYQNALDACRYRHVRRRYRERLGHPLTGWTGEISFRQGIEADGREFVECADNGVGMSRETLMRTFGNAGERFVYGGGFRAEQVRWQELDPPLRLIPNSQFGVGVFSYFMIAEEIHIVTRPVSAEDVVATQAFGVRIASSGSLFQVTPATGLPGGGTRVRIYLTGDDPISVLRTMRRLLWVAEYRVEVGEENGTDEVWLPQRLRYPGASVEPLQYGDDLWWVPGDGGLAADGIRTNKERYGIVVNLRGLRRPQQTVSRDRLRHWDKAWVTEQVRESLPALLTWPGLTLSWLWRVTEATPATADEIFARLLDSCHELPVGGSWLRAVPAPAERVGCLPLDQELFKGELVNWFDTSYQWLAAWRVGVWKGTATFPGTAHTPEPTRLDGFPVVRPLDAAVLSALYEAGRDYRSPVRFGHPSVDDLLLTSADEDEPPVTRLRRLRRYAVTGLDLAAARSIPPIHHVFTDEDRPLPAGMERKQLLGAVAAWAPPGASVRPAAGSLIRASHALHLPLGEVCRRAAKLLPTGWLAPAGDDLAELWDYVCSRADVDLVSRDEYLGSPLIEPTLAPADVVAASTRLGRPVGEVLAMLDRFAPLGYRVVGRSDYPDDLTHLEHETLRYVEAWGQYLTPLHMLVLAGHSRLPVRQVRTGLERLRSARMVRLPPHDPIPDAVPTDDELVTIMERLRFSSPRKRGQEFATGWLAVRSLVFGVGAREFAGFEERLARHRRLLDTVDLRRPVSVPELADLAYCLDYDLAMAVDFYRLMYPQTADLSALPDAVLTSPATCHRQEERVALVGQLPPFMSMRHEIGWRLGVGDIVSGAAMARQSITDFVGRLEPFRAVGAPLPVLDEAARAALAQRPADRHDRAMLLTVDPSGIEEYVECVTPLWLIQVAGRFGWTPLETHSRMSRLRPLGLTLDYPPDACPDEIVSWQDLLLLTVHLDGQAPAVSGVIAPEHIVAGAREIEEPLDRVRDRLRRYAALFGFTVQEAVAQPVSAP